MEKTTIVMTARDRFSTAAKCLRNVIKHTPEPYDLMVVMGHVPAKVEQELKQEFGNKARFILTPDFLNTAQARNRALKEAQTRLTIFLDSDVYVRPGWYEPLVQCQLETGADMVGNLVLDRQNLVHTAGGDFFFTEDGKEKYITMEIRFANQRVAQGTELKRKESDYIEVHCQLIVTETGRKYPIYDENITEFHEIDSGLSLAKYGCKIMFEPKSQVYLYYPERLTDVEDIEIFRWKWDMKGVRKSLVYLKQKWGFDFNHHGHAEQFFGSTINQRLNFFARRFPSKAGLWLDQFKYQAARKVLGRWG